MTLSLIAAATFFSTLLGGYFALRLDDRLHLVLGFSAGAILGVAFFDLVPEALAIGGSSHSISFVTAVMAGGFGLYLVLDRFFLMHGHSERSEQRGNAGAGSLSLHSFLDGVAVGLAFKVSPVLGLAVAAAVLAHDFSDGINTVNLVLKNGGDRKKAFRWLLIDAIAPVLGVISTLFFTVEEGTLGLLLALFAGFFLYIGASDLLPESYHRHPMKLTTFTTLLGVGVMYVIAKLAAI